MTTETKTVNNPVNVNSTNITQPYYSPYGNISDIFMNKMLMNSMNDIMKGTYQMTFHNIVKLIFLSQVSNIKQIVPIFYEYVKHMILWFLCFTKQTYYSIKSSKQDCQMIEDICLDDAPKRIYVDIEINDVFIKYFYNYLQTSKNCVFDIENINYNVKNCKDIITSKKISNIIITYENIDIKINTPIYLKINTNINNIESYTLNNTKKQVKSLFDCLKSEEIDVIKKVIDKEFNGKTHKEIIDFFENDKENIKRTTAHVTEFNIAELLIEKYKSFDKDETYVIILIISLIYSKIFYIKYKSTFMSFWIINICGDSDNIFNTNITYNRNQYITQNGWSLTFGCKCPNIKLSYLTEKEYNLFDKTFRCSIIDNINNSNTLQCELNNETDKTILEHFLNYINSFSPVQTIGTKITIFKLSIKKNIKKEEIPNPEYSLWTAKLDLIKSHTSQNKEKETQHEINNIICDSMPSKTICKESVVKELSVKEIKKIYRDIKSLYIDKQNKMLLKDNLEQFKNDKETLFEMGIDNKLNILLYGEPGTGKTTTIQTIASYLGKDIYYINLKEFETNADIQMIYDYISKNTGNGIIVYEDIDCMSDVVLKRTDEIKEISINDICDIENDKLSLSYFLNLLQGCLTPDDSINILTTNFKDKLDSAIFRSGRMDLTLELKPCSHFQIRNIFRKLMKREINGDVLSKIPKYKHTPATIIYHLKNYRKCTTMTDMDIFQKFF